LINIGLQHNIPPQWAVADQYQALVGEAAYRQHRRVITIARPEPASIKLTGNSLHFTGWGNLEYQDTEHPDPDKMRVVSSFPTLDDLYNTPGNAFQLDPKYDTFPEFIKN